MSHEQLFELDSFAEIGQSCPADLPGVIAFLSGLTAIYTLLGAAPLSLTVLVGGLGWFTATLPVEQVKPG